MQVAHFIGTMRPGHDGVSRVVYRMREELQSKETHHFFISPILPREPDADMWQVSSIRFPLSTDYRLSLCTTQSLIEFLKKTSPDLIHVHTPCTLGRAAIRGANALSIPVVATYHTHFPTYLKYYRVGFLENWVWRYLKSLYNYCAVVIVPSQTTLLELENHAFHNLMCIPHGVDTCHFSPLKRDQKWRNSINPEHRVIVTFVGRLVWEKNLKLLAEISSHLKTRDQIQWVIVGDGPARSKLQELMPEAYFTGYLGDGPLAIAYASSDIFVFPSETETFGNVTVEAMASGLPPVCASAGGACDLVHHGINGLLASASCPKAFAEAIDSLVTSPQKRKQFSEKAVDSIAPLSWKNSIKQYEEIYYKVAYNQDA